MPDPARDPHALADPAPGKPQAGPDKAWQSIPSFIRFLIPAALGLGADLYLKAWSFPDGVPKAPARGFPPFPAGRQPMHLHSLLDHVLGFQTTVNYGMVFGIGQGMAIYFLIFSIFAMALILWVFLTSKSSHWIVHIALGMITAGALGNLYDRAVFGGVRDMLKLLCFVWKGNDYYPYIFNIADVMLCIGVPLLMLRWMFIKDPPARSDDASPVPLNARKGQRNQESS